MIERVIFGGFGGQGVMTLGKLLAAVAMREGREVTCISSYGPEVRGGTVHCHVIFSDQPIYSPVIEEADTLILFNQLSYDKFRKQLRQNGCMVINSSLVKVSDEIEKSSPVKKVFIPATEAANKLGNPLVTNVMMLGAYCAARKVVSPESVIAEMKEMGKDKPHLIEINCKAFQKAGEINDNFVNKTI